MTTTREAVDTRQIRVGVVDDHRIVLDGIAANLRSLCPDIAVVATAPTWFGLLSHEEFPTDVVVLDLGLGDGISISTKLRTLATTGARAVVMSRHADAVTVQAAYQAGALSFVPKSDDSEELVRAIRAAAAGRTYRTPSTANVHRSTLDIEAPGVGRQELRALVLYSSGRSVREVATQMSTTEETVKSYLKRARRKYRERGIDLGSKTLLRRHAVNQGWLDPE